MRPVRILHPSFSKMVITFYFKASASTSLGMPTISRHSRLEYCAFNQHWRFILTSLLDRRVLTCFVALLFPSSCLFWSDKIIERGSFLLSFCNDSLVWVVMLQPSGWEDKNTGYKVKTISNKLILHPQATLWNSNYFAVWRKKPEHRPRFYDWILSDVFVSFSVAKNTMFRWAMYSTEN